MVDQAAVLTAFDIDLPVLIRTATAEDVRCLEWDREMWAFRELFEQAYQEMLQGRRLMLVADVGGHPVGRLFVHLSAGNWVYADGSTRAYLYSLHVMGPLQGRGIGTRLIQAAEQELCQRGFQWATIAVAVENDGARRLYERLGYTVFRRDDSRWSYSDPEGRRHEIREVCWALKKALR